LTLCNALAARGLTPTTAQADGSTDEHRFIVAVCDNLPNYVIPGGRFATDDDLLASGYQACAALEEITSSQLIRRWLRAYADGAQTLKL
jgi:hypothetical protein